MPTMEDSFSFGIEEEYFLVDAETKALARAMPSPFLEAAKLAAKRACGGQVTREMLQAQIEVATAPHTDMKAAHAQLRELRRAVAGVARSACDIGSADTGGVTAAQSAPAITSSAAADVTESSPGVVKVTAAGSPTSALSESGALPSGLSFTDNGNGTASLSGTPAAGSAGSYPITLTAANGVGPGASQSFTLTVAALSATGASPTTIAQGTNGLAVTIAGTGFEPGGEPDSVGPGDHVLLRRGREPDRHQRQGDSGPGRTHRRLRRDRARAWHEFNLQRVPTRSRPANRDSDLGAHARHRRDRRAGYRLRHGLLEQCQGELHRPEPGV